MCAIDHIRRRDSFAAALFALAVCALCPGSAGAASTARLRVALVPDRPGARTTIELSLQISGPGGAPPPPLTRMDLLLPGQLSLATTQLGQANCDPAALIAGGLQGCSANARIGFGDAVAVVAPGGQRIFERASLNALMGPPAEDRVEILFYAEGHFPVFAQLVFPALAQTGVPPFGERLNTTIPLVPAWPEGPDLSLVSLDSTIGPLHLTYHREVGGQTVAYTPNGFRIPQRCPRGGFPFAAELGFADGTHLTAGDRVRCPGR